MTPEQSGVTVIHRIWIGAPPPQEFIDYADTWRAFGYQVREWDERSILALGLQNQELWDQAPSLTTSGLVPRMRSDIARYEILYRFGGVYADHDFRCLTPIDPYIAGATHFAVQEKPGLIANGFMGGEAGHPFFKALMDNLVADPSKQVWEMTGPGYLTGIAAQFPDLRVLPTEKFLPVHYSNQRAVPPDDAVLAHTWGSARGQVSVIIPFRKGDPIREQALDFVLNQYTAHRDWQVVVQPDDGQGDWNKAAAVNEGVRRSFGDVLVVADADLLCTGIVDAVNLVRRTGRWAMPYSMLYRMNEEASRRVMAGEDPARVMKDHSLLDEIRAPYRGVLGGGIVVVARRVFEKAPMDERFQGWGGEDVAWGYALRAVAGSPKTLRHNLYHLWHPPQKKVTHNRGSDANYALYRRYKLASRRPHEIRKLMEEARNSNK